MIVLIDNYDSFTYNLVQRLGEMDQSLTMRVYRNDKTTVGEIAAQSPTHIIISPGPCTPAEAGVSKDVVAAFAGKVPPSGRVPGSSMHRRGSLARRWFAPTESCMERRRWSTTTERDCTRV